MMIYTYIRSYDRQFRFLVSYQIENLVHYCWSMITGGDLQKIVRFPTTRTCLFRDTTQYTYYASSLIYWI